MLIAVNLCPLTGAERVFSIIALVRLMLQVKPASEPTLAIANLIEMVSPAISACNFWCFACTPRTIDDCSCVHLTGLQAVAAEPLVLLARCSAAEARQRVIQALAQRAACEAVSACSERNGVHPICSQRMLIIRREAPKVGAHSRPWLRRAVRLVSVLACQKQIESHGSNS